MTKKNLFGWFTMMMVAVMSFTFASCSDDDDEEGSRSEVVGEWNFVLTGFFDSGGTWTETGTAIIRANGTALFYGEEECRWTLKGNVMTLHYVGDDEDEKETYTYTKIDNKSFKLSDYDDIYGERLEYVFTRK